MKTVSSSIRPEPWNKGRLIGQKRPLKPKEVWAIRVRLEIGGTKRNLALFNPAIDSKLRACGRPVQFEITEATREAVQSWISTRGLRSGFLFSSRQHDSLHLSTRQYARIVDSWVKRAGLDSAAYGTHSMRRTKQRRSTARPLIFEPCSCCSVTQSSKALCAISVSRLMMPSASQSRSSFEESAPLGVRRRKACRVRHERLVGRCQIVTQGRQASRVLEAASR
jgi:hypothetical protein